MTSEPFASILRDLEEFLDVLRSGPPAPRDNLHRIDGRLSRKASGKTFANLVVPPLNWKALLT